MSEFTHLDSEGKIKMVDVSAKKTQVRTAIATGYIQLAKTTIEKITASEIAKGNVLAAARIAGIQGAKQTWQLIPLCHNIALTGVDIDFTLSDTRIDVTSTARAIYVTGVEMEALTAATLALLTIYDMCKAIDKTMEISGIKLLSKEKKDA